MGLQKACSNVACCVQPAKGSDSSEDTQQWYVCPLVSDSGLPHEERRGASKNCARPPRGPGRSSVRAGLTAPHEQCD